MVRPESAVRNDNFVPTPDQELSVRAVTHVKVDSHEKLVRWIGNVSRPIEEANRTPGVQAEVLAFVQDDYYAPAVAGELRVDAESRRRADDLQEIADREGGFVRIVHAVHLAEWYRQVRSETQISAVEMRSRVLGGTDRGYYDCPKVVFAGLQEAGNDPQIAYPRFDADVSINPPALLRVANCFHLLKGRAVVAGAYERRAIIAAIEAGTVDSFSSAALINATGVRVIQCAPYMSMLRSLGVLGDETTKSERTESIDRAVKSAETIERLIAALPNKPVFAEPDEHSFVRDASRFLQVVRRCGVTPHTAGISGALFAVPLRFWEHAPYSHLRQNVVFCDDESAIQTRIAAGQACPRVKLTKAVVEQVRHEVRPTVNDALWHSQYLRPLAMGLCHAEIIGTLAFAEQLRSSCSPPADLQDEFWRAGRRVLVRFADLLVTELPEALVGLLTAGNAPAFELLAKLGFTSFVGEQGLAESIRTLPDRFPKNADSPVALALKTLVEDMVAYVHPDTRAFWREVRAHVGVIPMSAITRIGART